MSVSPELQLYSWLVEIKMEFPRRFNSPGPLNWNNREAHRISTIRDKFTGAGFSLVEMPMDYYTPFSKSRFKVKHNHPAAMTMMLLALKETQFTVVDENHYKETN